MSGCNSEVHVGTLFEQAQIKPKQTLIWFQCDVNQSYQLNVSHCLTNAVRLLRALCAAECVSFEPPKQMWFRGAACSANLYALCWFHCHCCSCEFTYKSHLQRLCTTTVQNQCLQAAGKDENSSTGVGWLHWHDLSICVPACLAVFCCSIGHQLRLVCVINGVGALLCLKYCSLHLEYVQLHGCH